MRTALAVALVATLVVGCERAAAPPPAVEARAGETIGSVAGVGLAVDYVIVRENGRVQGLRLVVVTDGGYTDPRRVQRTTLLSLSDVRVLLSGFPELKRRVVEARKMASKEELSIRVGEVQVGFAMMGTDEPQPFMAVGGKTVLVYELRADDMLGYFSAAVDRMKS